MHLCAIVLGRKIYMGCNGKKTQIQRRKIMSIFEIICMIGGAILGAISGLAAGIELPRSINTIKSALRSKSGE